MILLLRSAAIVACLSLLAVVYLSYDGTGLLLGFGVPMIAYVALGALVRQWWLLGLPAVISYLVGAAYQSEDALWAIGVLFLASYGTAATAIGISIGRGARRPPTAAPSTPPPGTRTSE